MSTLLKQALTVLVGRGLVRVAQAIAFLVMARFLTPTEFGWYGLVTTAMTLAVLLGSLGLRQSVAYQIGRRQMSVGEGTATVLVFWPGLAAASATVVFLLYGRDLPGFSQLNAALAIGAGVAAAMLLMLAQGVFLGRGDIRAFSMAETMPRLLLAAFTGILVLNASVRLPLAIWAYVLSLLAVLPAVLWFTLRGVERPQLCLDRVGAMLRYGLAFAVNLFLITLCTRLSIFVIAHFAGAELAGQFFAAARVNEVFLEAATALGLVLFSNSVRGGDDTRVPARNARLACWIAWSFLLVAVAVALYAPILLRTLLGANYDGASGTLQILAIGLGPAAGAKVIYPTIAGQGHPLFGTPVIGASLLANVAVAWTLVPRYGLHGGAWALVLGQYVLYIGYALSCRTLFNIPLRDSLFPRRDDVLAVAEVLRDTSCRALRLESTANTAR